MLNEKEKAFIDSTIKEYRKKSNGTEHFSFMDAAYKVAQETDEEGLLQVMPSSFKQIETESKLLRFKGDNLINRPLPAYVIDVNDVMSRYMDGLLKRNDAIAYYEAKL